MGPRLLPLLLGPGRPPRYISDRFLYVLSLERLLSGALAHVTLMSLPLPTSDEALRELHRFTSARLSRRQAQVTSLSLQQKPRTWTPEAAVCR